MKKKILSLLLIVLLTFTLTACDMLNNMGGGGGGTTTVDVNLDDVFLNVEAQINTKDALENNITLPTSFGSVNVTWVSPQPPGALHRARTRRPCKGPSGCTLPHP